MQCMAGNGTSEDIQKRVPGKSCGKVIIMNRYVQYMYSYPHKTAYRPLQNVHLRDYMENLEGEGHGLYLHIPFCESKCGYCNLFSAAGQGREVMEAYVEALPRQIEQYREILPESAVFSDFTIGGGTPLLLDAGLLERTLGEVKASMPFKKDCEIVIETAPKQTDPEKAGLLKDLGVTRVSMGVQSFAEEELAWLGRNHDAGKALEAAELLMNKGFACVNLDFIYGLPGQTAESLVRTLKTAVSLGPEEIFLYPLYIKHGVGLERRGKQKLLNSDHTYLLYRHGAAYLQEQGYVQVSMRCFASAERVRRLRTERPMQTQGYGLGECILGEAGEFGGAVKFQECGFTGSLALGCGGRSYLGRLHTCTPYRTTGQGAMEEIAAYLKRRDFLTVTHGIVLSDEELRRRYVIKHLLIRPGISRQAYRRRFGRELTEDFPILKEWTELGWVQEGGAFPGGKELCRSGCMQAERGGDGLFQAGIDFLSLTQEGLGLSDYIGPMLISRDIRRRMGEWERIYGKENDFIQGESEKL